MLDREKCEDFVRWLFQSTIIDWEVPDGFEIQDKLRDLGLIEERPVDPTENDLGADHLFFLKETD